MQGWWRCHRQSCAGTFLLSIIEMNGTLGAGVCVHCWFLCFEPFWPKQSNERLWETDTWKRKKVCVCVCMLACQCLDVCWAFHVRCVVPRPRQAPHTDQTPGLSGSAGWRGRGRSKMTGHLFHSRCALMSRGCCFLFFCTRCVPWAWAGSNTQHFIPEIPPRFCLILLQSMHSGPCMYTQGGKRKKKWRSQARAVRGVQFYLQTT